MYSFLTFIEYERFDSNKKDCRRISEEYRKNEIKENPNLSFYSPEYIYSRGLDACIYSGGFLDLSILGNNNTKYIKNLNTNEEIINSTYVDGKILYGISNLEFTEKEKELFNKN